MENMDIYSDSNDVEGINSTESLFLTQNRYGLLTDTNVFSLIPTYL